MKILVLGGNGFIGSHIVDRLAEVGHEVRVFDRNHARRYDAPHNVECIYGDFAGLEAFADTFEDIDVVYHLICTTVPSTSNDNPVADVTENVVTTLRLLDLLVARKVPKIVFLSSGGTVYGRPVSNPVPETATTLPICSHGITKLAIEKYLHMYRELHGLRYTILRVSNPYGERQGHFGVQGVIGTFIEKIRRGEVIEVWGDGSIQRDYIYVGDVAVACVRVAYPDVEGIYNIGSGRGHTISEVISTLAQVTERKLEPVFLPARPYDVPRIVLDCRKARDELSWDATTEFAEGIERTWRWVQSRRRQVSIA